MKRGSPFLALARRSLRRLHMLSLFESVLSPELRVLGSAFGKYEYFRVWKGVDEHEYLVRESARHSNFEPLNDLWFCNGKQPCSLRNNA